MYPTANGSFKWQWWIFFLADCVTEFFSFSQAMRHEKSHGRMWLNKFCVQQLSFFFSLFTFALASGVESETHQKGNGILMSKSWLPFTYLSVVPCVSLCAWLFIPLNLFFSESESLSLTPERFLSFSSLDFVSISKASVHCLFRCCCFQAFRGTNIYTTCSVYLVCVHRFSASTFAMSSKIEATFFCSAVHCVANETSKNIDFSV